VCAVVVLKLVEFYQQHTAVFTKRRVAEALRVAEIGTGGVVAGLVGKDAFKYQYFLAFGMVVGTEAGAGFVAHNTGGVTAFGVFACQRLAPYAGHRAGHPVLLSGVYHHSLTEIHIDHAGRSACL